jgi:CDP-glucose 4,6-dehydratase
LYLVPRTSYFVPFVIRLVFSNIYKGKKVLVTGNTGFKGSWLTVWLKELSAEVYGLSVSIPTQPSMFEVAKLEKEIEHHTIDIRNQEKTVECIQSIQPDFIFHMAAQPIVGTSYSDPVGTIATNALGTVYVLEGVRTLKNNCSVILITSDKCYENVEWIYGYRETDRLGGKDIYSASKGAAEVLIYSYFHSFIKHMPNVRMASVRAGNVIGGGDWAEKRLVPDCIRAWVKNEPVVIRNPESTRPWQHVLEPLSGYLVTGEYLAKDTSLNGGAINFGPAADQIFSVKQMLEAIGANWSFAKKHQLYSVESIPGFHEAGLLKLNCDKAHTYLRWKPVLEFEQTAKLTAAWYAAYYRDHDDMNAFTRQQINEYVASARKRTLSWVN